MPPRVPKACRKIACRHTTTESHGYCEEHKDLASWGKWQSERGKTIYNTAKWRRVRHAIIQRDKGLCQECKRNNRATPGTDCDHIIPLNAGGSEYQYKNLQLLCNPCHVAKTARE